MELKNRNIIFNIGSDNHEKLFFILITFSTFLFSCSNIEVKITKDTIKEYNEPTLKIGIIGDVPNISTSNITFNKIGFNDLNNNIIPNYDAIFISKNNLLEASKDDYIPVYKNSTISFYFLENEKSHVCFITKGLSYEDEPDSQSGMYITGLRYPETFGYGLYNDTYSEKNVQDTYNSVFQDIYKIKNENGDINEHY